MSLPSKEEIRNFAIGKKATEQIVKMGSHTPITPEPEEMDLKEAQLDIMRADKEALAEQEKYLQDMANEMKLKVIPIQELKLLKHETGYEWTNGWTKHEKKPKRVSLRKPLDIGSAIRGAPLQLPKLPKPIFQLPIVKHKKRHIQRTSKTMRVLRKRVKDGQKVFSFPDRIWKVRR